MEPFATIDDLNARRASNLTGRAASVAEAKLADASAKLAAEMDVRRVSKGTDHLNHGQAHGCRTWAKLPAALALG